MPKSQLANFAYINNSVYAKTFSTFEETFIDRCHYHMDIIYDLSVTV